LNKDQKRHINYEKQVDMLINYSYGTIWEDQEDILFDMINRPNFIEFKCLDGNDYYGVYADYSIYGLKFSTEAFYIGMTGRSLEERFHEHRRDKAVKFIEENGGIESAKLIYHDYALTKIEALYKECWITDLLRHYGYNASGGLFWHFALAFKEWLEEGCTDWLSFYVDNYTLCKPNFLFDDFMNKGVFGAGQINPKTVKDCCISICDSYLERNLSAPQEIIQYLHSLNSNEVSQKEGLGQLEILFS